MERNVEGVNALFGTEKDIFYMNNALQQARKAAQEDEVPVGAVIIDEQGVIIARAHNKVEQKQVQTAHAEVIALERACKKRGNWRLNGCWIYVTVEPCAMCMGLIALSRCSGVVYGASSPLFGCGLESMDLSLYRKGSICIVSGILAEESASLMKQFFQKKRS